MESQNIHRIAFASPHCLADCTSGAAVATASGLQLLQRLGFECEAFCGSRLDSGEAVEEMLLRHAVPSQVTKTVIGGFESRLLLATAGNIRTTIFRLRSAPGQATYEREVAAFIGAYDKFLDTLCPDAVLCYGGDRIAKALIELAKSRGIPVVFWLHNFGEGKGVKRKEKVSGTIIDTRRVPLLESWHGTSLKNSRGRVGLPRAQPGKRPDADI
jgi:hypothetical protein